MTQPPNVQLMVKQTTLKTQSRKEILNRIFGSRNKIDKLSQRTQLNSYVGVWNKYMKKWINQEDLIKPAKL